MSKARPRTSPTVKVEITIRPATAADTKALQRFWERLLAQKVASFSSKE